MKARDSFDQGGWFQVWMGLAEEKLSPVDAADFAEEMSRNLIGRPPLDPFWLEGAASIPKTNITPSTRVKTALAWLNKADRMDGWEPERIGFEMLYLLNTKFINWKDKADWKNSCESFAEAAIFDIQRPDIYNWRFDWTAVRKDWWKDSLENHPSLLVEALSALDRSKSIWGETEVSLAETALDFWSQRPDKKTHEAMGSSMVNDLFLSSWEKAVLGSRHKDNPEKNMKPTL